jgi:hypothetical protein
MSTTTADDSPNVDSRQKPGWIGSGGTGVLFGNDWSSR